MSGRRTSRCYCETGFFTGLRLSGVLVRERFSEVNPGEVTGYAVTLPGNTGQDGMPRWFDQSMASSAGIA